MSELSTGDDTYSSDHNTDTHSSGENWHGQLTYRHPSSLGELGAEGHDPVKEELKDDEKDEVSEKETDDDLPLSQFLLLPSMVREKMYMYLHLKDLLTLRKVCLQLLLEIDNFVDFTVVFRKPLTRSFVPIPFPHLKFLTVDNPNENLPWFLCTPTKNKNENDKSEKSEENFVGPAGTIETIKIMAVTSTTLERLAQCRTIKGAIITTDVFERKLPQLNWPYLTSLRLHFYIVRFVGSHELEMLENFDSLCSQTFPNLTSLKICLRRSYLNPQSSFSVRSLRFMAKHYQTLRDMTIEMEAEKCDLYPQTTTPEFTPEELSNLKKIQLNSLKIDATELLCRKCRIWQDFIQQQKSIDSLTVSIYSAQGHQPVFFYPVDRNPKKRTMKTVSIGLWGLTGPYHVDIKNLTNGLDAIYNIRLFRSSTFANEHNNGAEILNMLHIPPAIVSLTIKGFTVAARDIEILLRNAHALNHLTLKNVGGMSNETGVQIEHLGPLQNHPNLATCCIDISNPVQCTDESYELFMRALHNGRMEYKVIGRKDNLHTFLFIDRQKAQEIMMKKPKLHDDEVLPGLEYPLGFLNRFDNWKIRS